MGLLSHVSLHDDLDQDKLRSLSKLFNVQSYLREDKLWDLTSEKGELHFILSGAFSEKLVRGKDSYILRFYRKGKFAFSEDLLLYSTKSETECECLLDAKIASIPVSQLFSFLANDALSSRLIGVLIGMSLTEYRNTTYEMLQTNGTHRISAALEQFPDLLNIIPRKELADYLGISRASLFRSLKQLDHE
jgi:CRP-like cAMP-binding protein